MHVVVSFPRLSGCLITRKGFTSLISALCTNPSSLKELDLSYNHLEEARTELESVVELAPHLRLDAVRYGEMFAVW